MKHRKSLIPGLAAFLVLAVFAVGVLGTLLGGAGIYRRLTERDRASYDSRTCLQYIATRVRQAPGKVEIAAFGDGDALVIPDVIENKAYLTRVYCWDGWLMELFTEEDGLFSPEDGEKLLPAQGITLEQEKGLLKVMLTDQSGTVHSLYLDGRLSDEK